MSHNKGSEYRVYIAKALQQSSVEVSDLWLASLKNVVNEDTRDIFPTAAYLDHIPEMINEVGITLESDDDQIALTNSLINRKAEQLGTLRHQQKASVNQLLREYDLLSAVLEEFVLTKTKQYPTEKYTPQDCMQIMASIARVVRSILQSTVDAFVSNYMETIKEQTDKIQSFNTFITHELKTPLQAALLNIELIMEEKDPLNEEARDLIRVQSSIQQAAALLKNIENLFKNSDTMYDIPTVQEVALSALLSDIKLQLNEAFDHRDINIHVSESLGSISADTAKLRLVFTNLLTNAIKYRDPDKDSCDVWIEPAVNDSGEISGVVVRDNGLGIEKSMQKDVFNIRVRAHESSDEALDNSGHGLGLYLVSESIQELNGSISLTSVEGEGAKFLVQLPGITTQHD